MKTDRRSFVAAGAALVVSPLLSAADVLAQANDPENTIYLDTKDGRVTIRLRPDLAPKHVAQIKTLVSQGFYDGIVFGGCGHVIGFV